MGLFTYLHSFDDFFGEETFSWLPSENKVDEENLRFQRHINFLIKLQCLFLFYFFFFLLIKTLFLEAGQLNFSSSKKIDAGNYNIQLSIPVKILQ